MLSIDVVIGSMLCSVWLGNAVKGIVEPIPVIMLGLTIWIVYTIDHLSDARKINSNASTARHRFHQRHYRLLTKITVMVVILDACLVIFINTTIIAAGGALGLLVVLYLVSQAYLVYFKEIAGTILYCTGLIIPSLPFSIKSVAYTSWFLIVQFMLTVLINLFVFAWFDYPHDLRDNRASTITIIGKQSGKFLLLFLFFLQACLFLISFAASVNFSRLILLLMNLVLLIIFLTPSYFSRDDRYRYAGDGIFMISSLIFVFP